MIGAAPINALAPGSTDMSLSQLEQLAITGVRVAKEAAGGGGPTERAAVLRVQLNHALASGAPVYRVNELHARLKAAEQEAAYYLQGQQSGQEWASLGKTGVATGIGVGAALAFLILMRALK